jgi:hypothetical protein
MGWRSEPETTNGNFILSDMDANFMRWAKGRGGRWGEVGWGGVGWGGRKRYILQSAFLK